MATVAISADGKVHLVKPNAATPGGPMRSTLTPVASQQVNWPLLIGVGVAVWYFMFRKRRKRS